MHEQQAHTCLQTDTEREREKEREAERQRERERLRDRDRVIHIQVNKHFQKKIRTFLVILD